MVSLCKLDTAIRAARVAYSGWSIAFVAATSAARLSSSTVVTPG